MYQVVTQAVAKVVLTPYGVFRKPLPLPYPYRRKTPPLNFENPYLDQFQPLEAKVFPFQHLFLSVHIKLKGYGSSSYRIGWFKFSFTVFYFRSGGTLPYEPSLTFSSSYPLAIGKIFILGPVWVTDQNLLVSLRYGLIKDQVWVTEKVSFRF